MRFVARNVGSEIRVGFWFLRLTPRDGICWNFWAKVDRRLVQLFMKTGVRIVVKRIQDPFLGGLRSILSPGIFSTFTQLGTAHKSWSVSITLLKHWADLLYVVKFKQRDAKNPPLYSDITMHTLHTVLNNSLWYWYENLFINQEFL